ncbi:MAG: hypothetical protein AAF611_09050 [Bacteroidota bacterium]
MKKIYILLFVLVLATSCAYYGEKKVFDGTEIYYTDGVTVEQVEKLGESLVASGFTDGRHKSVQFVKEGEKYVFKMIIKEEFLENEAYENLYKFFPKELSNYVNLPVDFHVCDNQFNTLKVYKLEDSLQSVMAKGTEIRYTKKMLPTEVEKLRTFLIESGFSDDTPKTVELDRENTTYIFKMVIDTYRLKSEANLSILRLLKGELSKKVFSNFPVKIHACDELMNPLKII